MGPQLIGLPGVSLLFHDEEQRGAGMPIYRLLQNSPLGPEELKVLTDAYEQTLRRLSLVDRNDPITELVARKIIELGQRGVREVTQLSELAIKELGVEPSSR